MDPFEKTPDVHSDTLAVLDTSHCNPVVYKYQIPHINTDIMLSMLKKINVKSEKYHGRINFTVSFYIALGVVSVSLTTQLLILPVLYLHLFFPFSYAFSRRKLTV